MSALPQADEARRLAALHRYEVLDSPPEEAFDAIVRLAAGACDMPISLITLIDEARQWFKARVGLELTETIRESSFCAYAIGGQPLTVPDTLEDERFRNNPLVLGEPQIRFYAGMPLVTNDGFALGALCVIDRKPHAGLSPHERETLKLLARETMTQLELRRALRELSDTKRALEDVNLELDAFAAAAAHDLRAPVRHINGFADLLVEDCGDNPAAHRHVLRIRAACNKMGEIIDSLLRLSRASHAELQPQPVDLSALVHDACAELRSSEPERQVEFGVKEGVIARADPGMIRIVLVNLLSNAWKFTRQKSPARIEFGVQPAGQLTEYYVRDNGIGFDPAIALLPPRPFIKHQSSEGVGLGLTIIERIVRRHGGTLRAESSVGGGATFSFTLAS